MSLNHWPSIDSQPTPLVGKMLKFIFSLAQAKDSKVRACMCLYLCMCVCVFPSVGGGRFECTSHHLFLLLQPLCSLLNDPSLALNKTWLIFIRYTENPQLVFIFSPGPMQVFKLELVHRDDVRKQITTVIKHSITTCPKLKAVPVPFHYTELHIS